MATVYTKTYNFNVWTEIPYRYKCGKCGEVVEGKVKLEGKDEAKVSSRHANGVFITDESRRQHEAEAINQLRAQVKQCSKGAKNGNFDILAKHAVCPHCGTAQKWAYRKGHLVFHALGALVTAVLAVLTILLLIKDKSDGGMNLVDLVVPILLLLACAVFVLLTFNEIKGMRTTREQSDEKPELLFDQMTSPWLDRLKD